MTAMAMTDRYRIDFDADVNSYLRTWTLPGCEQPRSQAVSLRSLLCHQAEIFDAEDGFGDLMFGQTFLPAAQVSTQNLRMLKGRRMSNSLTPMLAIVSSSRLLLTCRPNRFRN